MRGKGGDIVLWIFCRSDNTVICTMCLHVGSHQGHKGAHVLDAAKEMRERLQQDDATLATLAERLRATAGTLAGRCAAVDASEARELARVGAWRRALVQAVEAREQALGEEVRQKAQTRRGELQQRQQRVAEAIARVEAGREAGRRAGRGSDVGLLQAGEGGRVEAEREGEGCVGLGQGGDGDEVVVVLGEELVAAVQRFGSVRGPAPLPAPAPAPTPAPAPSPALPPSSSSAPLCRPVPPPAPAPVRNAFAPVAFDRAHSSPGGGFDASAPLRLKNGNKYPVLGQRGMAVRAGSGDVGFVAARVVASAGYGYVRMGLAVQDVSLTDCLGCSVGAFAWIQDGCILNRLTTLLPATDGSEFESVRTQAGFGVGDTVGLMVDCRAAPQLRLFVNGVQRDALALTPGATVFPAWAVYGGSQYGGDSELVVEENPAVPE